MITGTICLVVGTISMIAFPFLFWHTVTTMKEINILIFLSPTISVAIAIVGLGVGLATYTCSPSSPMFGWPGPCDGGVPWP